MKVAGCLLGIYTMLPHCSLGGNDSIPSISQSAQFFYPFCQSGWSAWAHNPATLDERGPSVPLDHGDWCSDLDWYNLSGAYDLNSMTGEDTNSLTEHKFANM